MKHPVKLGEIPSIKLLPVPPVDAAKAKEIRALIGALSKIDKPDYGFSPTMSGQAFLPVDGQHESTAFLLTSHGLESSSALKELISLGPDALPFLLESLEDQTPTGIKLEHRSAFGAMLFAREMGGNPLNPLEAETLRLNDDDPAIVAGRQEYATEFTVKFGDICFVAIGQIVGRTYQAVRYQPTACIVINSPTHDADLAARVRKIWTSENARELVFQSLLRDYYSIGVHHEGDSLGVWDVGSRLQCAAALRLLYYYPKEAGKQVAERVKDLDVDDTREGGLGRFVKREVKNGVRTDKFIHAVSWCQIPEVREAVTEVFLKTTDDDILLAAVPGVVDPEETIIPERLGPLLSELPPDEGPIYGFGWTVLLAWTKASPKTARSAMQEYIKKGGVQRLQTACAVLRETSPDWKTQFLRPLLDDRRPLKRWIDDEVRTVNGRTVRIRLCDIAAQILAHEDDSLNFKLEGPVKSVDSQIATIRRQLDQR